MAQPFEPSVIAAVLRHMNDDHAADNTLIARAFADPGIVSAEMTGFDDAGGDWLARRPDGTDTEVRVPWPGGTIAERPEVRREIVALYDEACARLGVDARPHG